MSAQMRFQETRHAPVLTRKQYIFYSWLLRGVSIYWTGTLDWTTGLTFLLLKMFLCLFSANNI